MVGLRALLHLYLQPLLVSAFLQPPTNLSLFSQNFQHILTWDEPNDEPLIYYDVFYSKVYGNSRFVPAKNCSNLTIQRCDLTKHFTDIFEEYTTGVQSFTHSERTNLTIYPFPLNPKMDSLVGPPIVDVVACDSCIELSIRPPISYLWNEKEQRNVTMLAKDVFPKVDYMIHLVPSMDATIRLRTISEEHYTTKISNLLPNTNYCVSVSITEIMNGRQVPSPMKCVVTKGAQEKGDTNVYYITAAAAILAIGLLLLLCGLDKSGYISRKEMFTPSVLKSLPSANYLLNGNKESIFLESLNFTETVRGSEVEEGHIFMAGVQENASYITNNRAFRIMEQHIKNKDSFTGDELSQENSPVSIASLRFQGVNISEDASDQAAVSLSIANVTEEHPVVSAMSSINMRVSADRELRSVDMKGSDLFTRNKPVMIDINTISIADSGDLWTSCRSNKFSSLESGQPHMFDDPVDTLQFKLFSRVLILDEPQMSSLENVNEDLLDKVDCEVEDLPCKEGCEVEDLPCKEDFDEQFHSDYIKR